MHSASSDRKREGGVVSRKASQPLHFIKVCAWSMGIEARGSRILAFARSGFFFFFFFFFSPCQVSHETGSNTPVEQPTRELGSR